jgi:hypothetical protein
MDVAMAHLLSAAQTLGKMEPGCSDWNARGQPPFRRNN